MYYILLIRSDGLNHGVHILDKVLLHRYKLWSKMGWNSPLSQVTEQRTQTQKHCPWVLVHPYMAICACVYVYCMFIYVRLWWTIGIWFFLVVAHLTFIHRISAISISTFEGKHVLLYQFIVSSDFVWPILEYSLQNTITPLEIQLQPNIWENTKQTPGLTLCFVRTVSIRVNDSTSSFASNKLRLCPKAIGESLNVDNRY